MKNGKKAPNKAKPKNTSAMQENLKDYGFGSKVSGQTKIRLLNHDGTFNVERRGLNLANSISPYHALITMSWAKFHLVVFATYIIVNLFFGMAYLLSGEHALSFSPEASFYQRFLSSFFFSVQTFTTVGYGTISPVGFWSNLIATVDAFVGLISFALATGLLFARFSRPTAKIIYSNNTVVAPYKGISALMFRIANARKEQLINVEVKASIAMVVSINGKPTRRFHSLNLERDKVTFFPLNWTIVHPIDEKSPLFGMTATDFEENEIELLIQIYAIDDTFSTAVHSRSSYYHDEIVYGAKFSDMFFTDEVGSLKIDIHKLHDFEFVTLKALS